VALINDNDCMWMIIIRCVIHTGNMAAWFIFICLLKMVLHLWM
jgi:hypothetical protein